MKVIHISDLHFKSSRSDKINNLITKIIEEYSQERIKPLVIITGDLVEGPSLIRMKNCYAILKRLKEAGHDVLLCPGNHDVKGTLKILWKEVHGSKYIEGALLEFNTIFSPLLPQESWELPQETNNLLNYPRVNKYDNYYFIGLDSNNNKDNATGTIGSEQLDKLKNQIYRIKSENINNKITVYFHHNLFSFDPGAIPGSLDAKKVRLTDRKELRSILKDDVDAIMFGHFHVNKNYSSRLEELGNPLLQLAGNCVFSKNEVNWFEFDLEQNLITEFSKSG